MKKKGRFGKRTAFAGGIGIAVLLGWLLSMVPGFGVGQSGDGEGESDTEGQAEVMAEAFEDADVVGGVTGNQETADGNVRVIDVILDSRQYEVRSSQDESGPYKTQPLAEVVRLAKSASGNEDGIRVRISRRRNARVTTQKELLTALNEAGLSDDEILLLKDFID